MFKHLSKWIGVYKWVSDYTEYKHVSFNLRLGKDYGGKFRIHPSIHFKYRFHKGRFWYGFRYEIEARRWDKKAQDELKEIAKHGRMQYTCYKCKKIEFGPEGLGKPEGWEFLNSFMQVCGECVDKYTYRELTTYD